MPGVGPQQPGEHVEQRRLARPVGAEDGQHVARGDGERDVEGEAGRWTTTAASSPAVGSSACGHDNPSVARERPTAMTTTATATSSSDSATAPSTSVSRSR